MRQRQSTVHLYQASPDQQVTAKIGGQQRSLDALTEGQETGVHDPNEPARIPSSADTEEH